MLQLKLASGRRDCRNKPDVCFYICGEFTLVVNVQKHGHQLYKVFTLEKCAFHSYFGMKLGDPAKVWAPCMVRKTCMEHLRQWTKRVRSSSKFGISMVWKEPSNHATCTAFCVFNVL